VVPNQRDVGVPHNYPLHLGYLEDGEIWAIGVRVILRPRRAAVAEQHDVAIEGELPLEWLRVEPCPVCGTDGALDHVKTIRLPAVARTGESAEQVAVMVSQYHGTIECAKQIERFVYEGVISDEVASDEDPRDTDSAQVREYCLESRRVAMEVCENADPHPRSARLSELPDTVLERNRRSESESLARTRDRKCPSHIVLRIGCP
jgi:hypothetical protein